MLHKCSSSYKMKIQNKNVGTVCSHYENLAFHWLSMEREVFLEWTDYSIKLLQLSTYCSSTSSLFMQDIFSFHSPDHTMVRVCGDILTNCDGNCFFLWNRTTWQSLDLIIMPWQLDIYIHASIKQDLILHSWSSQVSTAKYKTKISVGMTIRDQLKSLSSTSADLSRDLRNNGRSTDWKKLQFWEILTSCALKAKSL